MRRNSYAHECVRVGSCAYACSVTLPVTLAKPGHPYPRPRGPQSICRNDTTLTPQCRSSSDHAVPSRMPMGPGPPPLTLHNPQQGHPVGTKAEKEESSPASKIRGYMRGAQPHRHRCHREPPVPPTTLSAIRSPGQSIEQSRLAISTHHASKASNAIQRSLRVSVLNHMLSV